MANTDFIQKIQSTIETNHLFTKDDTILVGVSGGIDSMTLIQSLYELGYSVAIAHCNFNLRGDESDGDQDFVVAYANAKKIPIHVCSFDTKKTASERKISIEMAARDLRYEWFETVCRLSGYTKVAIAHNQNDSVETFFINLLRSAGLKGLTGIPMIHGNVVRPMLNVSRVEIETFAKLRKLRYRVDSTNLSNNYVRNKIRNLILPEIQKIAPNCMDAISTSMSHLQQAYAVYSQAMEGKKSLCCTSNTPGFVVDELKLLQQDNSQTLLYEILYPCGFNTDVISQIYQSIGNQSGKKFESEHYVVVHDRNTLFVEPRQAEETPQNLFISEQAHTYRFGDCELQFERVSIKDFNLEKSSDVASLDAAKLRFPLTLRVWQKGDSFVPFGMKGRKKLSDFLIDVKVPLLQKQKVLVLESAGEIAWVVGYRISQEFAVTEQTNEVVVFRKM